MFGPVRSDLSLIECYASAAALLAELFSPRNNANSYRTVQDLNKVSLNRIDKYYMTESNLVHSKSNNML